MNRTVELPPVTVATHDYNRLMSVAAMESHQRRPHREFLMSELRRALALSSRRAAGGRGLDQREGHVPARRRTESRWRTSWSIRRTCSGRARNCPC